MRFNFGKYSSSKINDLGVGYDYNSVMHYGSRAFSKDGRSTTITIKGNNPGNVRLGQRYRLSKLDKKQAQLLYSCGEYKKASSQPLFYIEETMWPTLVYKYSFEHTETNFGWSKHNLCRINFVATCQLISFNSNSQEFYLSLPFPVKSVHVLAEVQKSLGTSCQKDFT